MSIFKKQKQKKQELKITCPFCKKIIQKESILQAEKKSKKKVEESMKKFGTINVKAQWEIHCNNCKKKIFYNTRDGKISIKPD